MFYFVICALFFLRGAQCTVVMTTSPCSKMQKIKSALIYFSCYNRWWAGWLSALLSVALLALSLRFKKFEEERFSHPQWIGPKSLQIWAMLMAPMCHKFKTVQMLLCHKTQIQWLKYVAKSCYQSWPMWAFSSTEPALSFCYKEKFECEDLWCHSLSF